jgi:beta-glucanase (GH16 family)
MSLRISFAIFALLAAALFVMGCRGLVKHRRWVLVWSDEFEGQRGSPPDPHKWLFDLGASGWGNHELEEYTSQPENISLDGKGHLMISAIASGGKFTSARLKTKGRFKTRYGKVEARIQLPEGNGIWPAFWLLGNNVDLVSWPNCGEIDIMENIGKEPGIVHATVHGPGYSGGNGISARTRVRPTEDGFHVFSVEWAPNLLEFFVDGRSFHKVAPGSLPNGAPWVFDHRFFLLLNLAVGGEWPGSPDATTRFPQWMTIDWIRVWRLESRGGR